MKTNKCIDCGKEICGVSKRCKSCANRGRNNPAWLGGKDKEKYIAFDREIRNRIRYRDNFNCQLCSVKQVQFKTDRLEIHHIDYNKERTIPENLIALCKECHIKTNFNREYYQKFFEDLLRKRGLL